MPKIIDYGGRSAFFELAAFALVRDAGVDSLSRHGLARVLATSVSTVRRLLSSEADLRTLALSEVAVRRRRRLHGPGRDTGIEAALAQVGALVALRPEDVSEELVWWRLVVAAPTAAHIPQDLEHQEEGPLHHRFAVAARTVRVIMTAVPHVAADEAARLAPVLHAVVDGLGVAVAVGRLTPADAREVVRTHLEGLSGRAR